MTDLTFTLRMLYSFIVSLLMMWYSLRLFFMFKRRAITTGRMFLKRRDVSRVFSSFVIALFLLFVFSVTDLSEGELLTEIGRYSVNLSILFFLYALYKFYGVVKG